jgi:hypothetical protein
MSHALTQTPMFLCVLDVPAGADGAALLQKVSLRQEGRTVRQLLTDLGLREKASVPDD